MSSASERAKRWREHVKRCAASGMSRDVYCAWHGLSRSTLYRWERRLGSKPARSRVEKSLDAMEWIAVEPPADVLWQGAIRSSAEC
jgi:transposase-like protein